MGYYDTHNVTHPPGPEEGGWDANVTHPPMPGTGGWDMNATHPPIPPDGRGDMNLTELRLKLNLSDNASAEEIHAAMAKRMHDNLGGMPPGKPDINMKQE